ncbi:MAG: hypothetical protein EBX50_19115 [Chitinophagia bacterium]|nr:hypothetical protein [Chitinophagia bacterium]
MVTSKWVANIGGKEKFRLYCRKFYHRYMKILVKQAVIADPDSPHHGQVTDILIDGERITQIAPNIKVAADEVIDASGALVSPGWVDTFSHFCDPGYEYKETLETGAAAAAAGGFTRVFVLPNTLPVVDSKSQVEYICQQSKSLPVTIYPLGAITRGTEGKDLAEMYDMKQSGAVAFSDGILPLVEKGVINGRRKKKYREKIVSTFIKGTRKLYEFVNDNPIVAMLDCSYVNDTGIIRQNPKVTAINSAIEIDITGQVCADSIGTKMYSGVGGQMDFIRGAALSERGKAIIAMPSTTSGGISRIVSVLRTGAGVVTTRAHVHYVVTEYGTACLFGKDLKQRAQALVEIAHPNHRDMLLREAHERFGSLKNWV